MQGQIFSVEYQTGSIIFPPELYDNTSAGSFCEKKWRIDQGEKHLQILIVRVYVDCFFVYVDGLLFTLMFF